MNLDQAVDAYREGWPVIVKATDGGILHGEETLIAIADTDASLRCIVIRDVERGDFEKSEWPEILEAARQVFMEGRT